MTIKHGRLLTYRPTLTGEGKENRPAYGAGKIYECDPTAVMRLKEFMAKEKGQVTETTETTTVDIQNLHKRYMAGGSIKKIAAEANMPWQTLRAQFKQAGLSLRLPLKPDVPTGDVPDVHDRAADVPDQVADGGAADVYGSSDMPEEIPEGAKKRPYTPPAITEIPAGEELPAGSYLPATHRSQPAALLAFLADVRALGGVVEEASGVIDMRIRIRFGEVKHEQD